VEGLLGVFARVVGGGDDVAVGERLLAGGGEEALDVGLLADFLLPVGMERRWPRSGNKCG